MDLEVQCDSVAVTGKNSGLRSAGVIVAMSGVSLRDLVESLDADEVLDIIGRDAAIKFFGIEEAQA